MYFIYYFLTDIETKEEKQIVLNTFAGDVNEIITYEDRKYKINDYVEELTIAEEPEDY